MLAFACALLAVAAPPVAAPGVDDYTVALYRFDQAGERFADAGPLGLDARPVGGKLVEGRFGQGLDPAEGGVRVDYSTAMAVPDGLTLEAWVRIDGPAADLQRIAYRSGLYGLYTDAAGRGLTYFLNVGGEWVSLRGAVPQAEWTHLAGTYDGDWMRLYVNGEQVEQRQMGGPVTDSAAPFGIGSDTSGAKQRLNGVVDEVRLSSVARDDFSGELRFTPTTEPRGIAAPEGGLGVIVPEATVGRAAAPVIDGRLDEPVWADALKLTLRDIGPSQSLTQPTWAWLSYDETNLYLAVEAREARMAELRAEVRQPDGPVYNDDAIEIFIRPENEYYHLSVNALGTLYDAERQDATWDSGATVAAAQGERGWTVELALPLAAFGGLPADGTWRGNVARSRTAGPENSSWAPVGGRFHSPGRFGVWTFGAEPSRPEATTTTLVGEVRNAAGARLEGVPVSSPLGLARTDGFGRFRIEGLPRGNVKLAIASPRYQPLAFEVDLQQPVERIVLEDLAEVDPDALGQAVAELPDGFQIYAQKPFAEVDPASFPGDTPAGQPLQAFASRGEIEPLGAALVAARELGQVRVKVTPLTGPNGATIGDDRIDVHPIKRILMRIHYSRPAEDVAPRSRYLMPNEPFPMRAGTFRTLFVNVHVPADSAAGLYRGELVVTAETGEKRLPIEFEVLPLTLDAPRKHYSIYYSDNRPARSDEVVEQELADIRAHGADRILWRPRLSYVEQDGQIRADYTSLTQDVERQLAHGFAGPLIVWDGLELLARLVGSEDSEQFLRVAKDAIEGMVALGQERGWPEIVLTHGDEVFGHERLERYIRLAKAVRQVPGVRLYITFHTRPTPEVEAMTREIDPYVDLRSYHGHSLDDWISAGHTWEELGRALEASGDEGWAYYNLRGAPETPDWARLNNGYWLWLTPITTHVPWAYNSWQGDPLNDADGYDFGYAFPVEGRIISTRQWEAYREGIDDVRYLSTLENVLDTAAERKVKDPAITAARAWLTELRNGLNRLPLEPGQSAVVKAMLATFDQADYDRWRREAAEHILAVKAAL